MAGSCWPNHACLQMAALHMVGDDDEPTNHLPARRCLLPVSTLHGFWIVRNHCHMSFNHHGVPLPSFPAF
jgi:hypothetical protein